MMLMLCRPLRYLDMLKLQAGGLTCHFNRFCGHSVSKFFHWSLIEARSGCEYGGVIRGASKLSHKVDICGWDNLGICKYQAKMLMLRALKSSAL